MSNPPVDLAALAASVQAQTTAIDNFMDQQVAVFTSQAATVVVTDANGAPVTVPTWATVTTAQADVVANTSAINTLSAQQSTNTSNVTALQAAMTTANTNITSLQTSCTADEATLTTHGTTLTTLTTGLATANTTIAAIQTAQTTDEGNITSNTSSITALQAAQVALITRVMLSDGSAQYTNVIDVAQLGALIKVNTDVPARVRFYPTVALRDADAARASGTPATQDLGVLFDFTTTTGHLTLRPGPATLLYNDETTITNNIAYTVEPTDGTSVVTVTITCYTLLP
jgi:hypothetical protein